MKEKKSILLTFLIITAIVAVQCTDDVIEEYQEILQKSGKIMPVLKTTGSLQIIWKGGGQNGKTDGQPDLKQAFFHFDAHEEGSTQYPKGEIIYQVLNDDSTVHREIKANVQDVYVDADQKKAWFVASVYYDSKSQDEEHCDHGDEGCSHDDEGECDGGTHDDEGGCDGGTHDDEGGCDGGCTHDDDEGGCDDGSTHDDEGGCDDGCSHDDEGSFGGGSEGGSGKVNGKNSRVGQLIAVKVHDGGTPGANNDGITWRWFITGGSFIPSVENISEWPHLCKKTILEGNLVVHTR